MTDYILPAIVYLVLTMVVAVVWHLVLFKNVYPELGAFTREKPIMPLGLLSVAIQAVIMSFAYPYFYQGHPAMDGLRFGLLMGVFMATSAVIAEAGHNRINPIGKWIALEGTYYLLQFAAVGIAIGLAFGHSIPTP